MSQSPLQTNASSAYPTTEAVGWRRTKILVIGLSPYEVGTDWDWYAQAFLDHANAVEACLRLGENSHA